MKRSLSIITTIIGMIVSGFMFIDSRYANAQAVKSNTQSIKKMRNEQAYRQALNELYYLKSMLRKYPTDRQLSDKVNRAQDQVNYMRNRMR